jgi:hypothetical protein
MVWRGRQVAKIRWEPPGFQWAVYLVHDGEWFKYCSMLEHHFVVQLKSLPVPGFGSARYFETEAEALAFRRFLEGNTWRAHSRCDLCFNWKNKCLMI